ncbi:MAG TPA: hypothetical protein VHI54_10715 [Actinomycetota bacterium]|nr:hypothetical protein [Actinomycetota bacterium]
MKLVFLGLSLLFALPGFVHRLLTRRRRKALDRIAHQFGLQFAPVDLLGLIDHTFDLFNIADSARSENVVWGTWKGVDVKAGELWFDSGKRGPLEAAMGIAQHFTFAFVAVPAWLPYLKIERDPLAGVADDLGLDRIRPESAAFNRAYRVTCSDREFAYAFLDTRMMLWLLEVARRYPVEFEVYGRKMLLIMPRVRPGELPVLFGLAKGFRDRVPRMVLREYALAGA